MRPITARKVRQVLGAIFLGALIGAGLMAIALVRSGHVHADPWNADRTNAIVTCQFIRDDPTANGVIASIKNLKKLGYGSDDAEFVFRYALSTFCPEYYSLVMRTAALYNGSGSLV